MSMRTGVSGVGAVLLLLVACGDDGGSGGDTEAAGASDGPAVDEVVPDRELGEDVVAVGDVLVGQSPYDAEAAVLRSSDLGASWEPVSLPGMPEASALNSVHLSRQEGVAVVVGDSQSPMDEESPLYLWTSQDGIEWHGGLLTEVGGASPARRTTVLGTDTALLAGAPDGIAPGSDEVGGLELFHSPDGGVTWEAAQLPDLDLEPGGTVTGMHWLPSDRDEGHLRVRVLHMSSPTVGGVAEAGGASSEGSEDSADEPDDGYDRTPVEVLESTDDGRAWQPAACPPEAVTGEENCRDVTGHDGLRVRGAQVSVDDGETWQLPAIEPDPDIEERESLDFDAVEGGTEDGWLATVSTTFAGDVAVGLLLRSDDGLSWRHLHAPDPCWEREDIGRPNSSVSDPVQLGGEWFAAYSCVDLNDPAFAQLLVVDEGGDERVVDGTRTDGIGYEQPLVVDDTLVVPVSGERERMVAFLHVRP